MRGKIHFLMGNTIACGCNANTCKKDLKIKNVNCKKCIKIENNYQIISENRFIPTVKLAKKMGKSVAHTKDLRKKLNLKKLYPKIEVLGEKWKNLNEYPGLEVSNFGKFRNKTTGRLFNLSIRKNRLFLWTRYKGKRLEAEASKLVYKYFVNEHINHPPYFVDGNPLNIKYDNLTTRKPFHKHFLKFLEKTKIEVKSWIKNYDSENFISAKIFAKLINIPYHKMCSYMYAMKKFLGMETNEKIKFYILCKNFVDNI